MNPYAEGKIYKLFASGDDTRCYIGSTVMALWDRLAHHKAHLKAERTCTSKVLFENNAIVQIELLEAVNCTTKQELEIRERYWIDNTPTALNIQKPGRTHKQWLAENKEQQAKYRADNAEHIKAAEKERYAKGYKATRNAAKKEKATCDICNKVMNKNSLWEHRKNLHPPVPAS